MYKTMNQTNEGWEEKLNVEIPGLYLSQRQKIALIINQSLALQKQKIIEVVIEDSLNFAPRSFERLYAGRILSAIKELDV